MSTYVFLTHIIVYLCVRSRSSYPIENASLPLLGQSGTQQLYWGHSPCNCATRTWTWTQCGKRRHALFPLSYTLTVVMSKELKELTREQVQQVNMLWTR